MQALGWALLITAVASAIVAWWAETAAFLVLYTAKRAQWNERVDWREYLSFTEHTTGRRGPLRWVHICAFLVCGISLIALWALVIALPERFW